MLICQSNSELQQARVRRNSDVREGRVKSVHRDCLRFMRLSVSVPPVPLHSLALPSVASPPLLFPEGPAVNFDLHKQLVKCLCNSCVCVCGCVFIHLLFLFFFLPVPMCACV